MSAIHDNVATPDTPSSLDRIASLAEDLGARSIQRDTIALRDRLSEGRFLVACVGAVKRGKSTLLNALVGERVLPVGIVPVTAVPTVLRHGTSGARVRLHGSGWRDIAPGALTDYVSEERNPGNALGVEIAEVFVPAPLLANGMSLVDTPGLGSVFPENTATTHAFLPQIDAAIAVIGADPPISGDELALLEQVAAQAPHLLVVLNKADRFTEAQLAEAGTFAERILATRIPARTGSGCTKAPRVYQVSATEAIDHTAPLYDWLEFVQALRTLESESSQAMLGAAVSRGVSRLGLMLRDEIDERRAALVRPVRDSERRVDELHALSADAAHRTVQLTHLFNAEEQELGREFERRTTDFRAKVESAALARLDSDGERLTADRRSGPRHRRDTIAAVRGIVRELLAPWLAELQDEAESLYREVEDRFVSMANDFIERATRAGDKWESRVPERLTADEAFRVHSRFYWTDMMPVADPVAPGRWLLDVISSTARQRRSVRRDAERYLQLLLDVNTAGAAQDLRERVRESRRKLEAQVQRSLLRVCERAERALEFARAAQAAGNDAIRTELGRLDEMSRELVSVHPETWSA